MNSTAFQNGFTYIGLLILLAILCLGSAVTMEVVSTTRRRDAELELLSIGKEMEHALQSYASLTPPGLPKRPLSLEELTADKRAGRLVRHLRRIYPDPLTGNAAWGVVRDGDRRIVAVFSIAPGVPMRKAGLSSYADLQFGNLIVDIPKMPHSP